MEIKTRTIGYPKWSETCDYIMCEDGEKILLSSLVDDASGVRSAPSGIYRDAENPCYDENEDNINCADDLSAWRRFTGKMYPPVYEIEISIKATVLTDEDVEEFFKTRQADY